MAESFDGLRSYVSSAVFQPEFAVVQGRARRLRRRRTITTGVVTAVLLLLVLAYAAQTAPHRHGQPAVPSPSPSFPAGNLDTSREEIVAGGPHDLYALRGTCHSCAEHLSASADGGSSWQIRILPPAPKGENNANRNSTLVALGPGLLAWIDPDKSGSSLQSYDWISIDGGATWRRPEISTSPVAAVPAGTAPIGCAFAGRRSPCLVYAIDPATGRIAPLADQPTGIAIEAGSSENTIAPVDGEVIYQAGLDPASRKPAAASSTDGGRTWRYAVFAAGDRAAVPHAPVNASQANPAVIAGAGRTAYAVVEHDQQSYPYRTTDGGRTWRPVSGLTLFTFGYVAPDGGYVFPTGVFGPPFAIFRGDGPPQPIAVSGLSVQSTGDNPRQPAVGLYVAPAEPSSVYLSHDGVTWHKADVR